MANQLAPFAFGTKPQEVQGQAQQWAANSVLQWELPTAGILAGIKWLFNGTQVVTTAGSAGTPSPWNYINRYSVNVSFGYEYRGLDGDSLYFANQFSHDTNDPVLGSPIYQNYNPTTITTAQPVQFMLVDMFNLNDGIDFDEFLIPYQSFSKKIYAQLTTGPASAVAANTEVLGATSITITPTYYFYTIPDTNRFSLPDFSMVQQMLDEKDLSGTMVGSGANLINLTPVNGPEYLGLGFKLRINGAFDSADHGTALDHIRLLANATVQIDYITAQNLIDKAYRHFKRALPTGWFYLPFSDDISLVNAMGPSQRNVFDTSEYTQLQIEITLKNATTVGSDNYVKLFKRLQSKAIAA